VGRESELAELTSALDDALSGRGGLAVITGEPGIGKTGLSEAFEQISVDRGALVLWGRCYEESGAPPYWPWVQAIRNYIRDANKDSLQGEMGPGAVEIAAIVPEVGGAFPNLAVPESTNQTDVGRFRLFDAIASFLRRASENQPLVLILEDLQDADGDSLRLLEFVARELSNTNVMIVGTYRDVELGRRHPLSRTLAELRRSSNFHRLLLLGLNEGAIGEFVASALGTSPPPGIAEAIHEMTQGKPLFVTETLRLMRQEGWVEPEALQSFSPEDLPLPEGIREAIGRHLDVLTEACSELMTVAAVMGRQFEYRYLLSLTKDPPDGARPQLTENELDDLLDEAIRARVIEEISTPGADYQFTHALIKETLTEEITLTRRARMHARVALMLEDFHGIEPARQAAQLAFHFGEAQNVLGSEKFIQYSLLAGTQSLAANAYEVAIEQFQRGLSAKEGQPDDLETAELLNGLGRAQMTTLNYDDPTTQIGNFRKAFDIYLKVGSTDKALAIPQQMTLGRAGANAAARELLSKALEIAPENSVVSGQILSKYGSAVALGLAGC